MKRILLSTVLLVGCSAGDSAVVGQVTVPQRHEDFQVAGVMEEALPANLTKLPEEYQRLTVPYLKTLTYPGSDIEIEDDLGSNGFYATYVAAYQSENLRIQGLLTVPMGDVPPEGYPGVVFIHGYVPPKSYVTTEKYEDYLQYLSRNKLVVFKIDLRGHGESEGEPNGAYFSGDYVIDTLHARASLARMPEVNPAKIGLWGHSMAGNVVLRAMAVDPSIHAGVIWAGAVYTYADMRLFGIQDSSYQPSQNPQQGRRQEMYKTVGEPDSGSEFWEWVKPVNYLGDLQGLVQLHHATADPVVSVEYSRNLKQLLDQAGVSAELFEYQSGGHNLSSPAFTEAMGRSVEALKGK
jgi:uncharacterized protein